MRYFILQFYISSIKKPTGDNSQRWAYIKFLASTYSPTANAAVPSAQEVLASEFGMGLFQHSRRDPPNPTEFI